MIRTVLVTIATVVTLAPVGHAQTGALLKVDSIVRAELERQKIPGVAVAIVRHDSTLLAKGYGVANVEHRVPVTTQTIFQSGSVGKQFTSAAVMLQVEAGKLKLDDSITRFFPDAPATWKDITVRHLLTHTSGIPDYTTDAMDYRRDYTEDELAKMAYQLKLEFPAGTRWNYSNTGYVLLGIIVRKVSGRFYGDVLAEHVFKPLGMKTARVISEADIIPNRAAGYVLADGQLRNQEWVAPSLNTTADGALYLSLDDMIAWDRGLRAGRVLSADSWRTVLNRVQLKSGNPYPYGFGWSVDSIAGQPYVGHGGAWQGFRAHIDRYLGDDLTVIVLANLVQADVGGIARSVAAALNPALAPISPQPIADKEPAQTAKLKEVLTAAAGNALQPADFAYVRAGFFPNAARRYAQLLSSAGDLTRVVVLERRTLGDDRISSYEVHFDNGVYLSTLGVAPDGRISTFTLRRK
jgi:CubicO group peptidase (beta-lactamase class C family)